MSFRNLRAAGLVGVLLQLMPSVEFAAGAIPAKGILYDQIVEKGLNHTRFRTRPVSTNAPGTEVFTNHTVVRINPGERYIDPVTGVLTDSEERIDEYATGAVYQRGPVRVIFELDIASENSLDILTPDGKRLKGGPVGLSIMNPVDGTSTLIAEVKSSKGKLDKADPRKIVFRDFLDGVLADCVYLVGPKGLSQTIVLRERIDPGDWGMPLESRLEVISSFETSHQPVISTRVLKESAGKQANMASPSLTDSFLNFGSLVMPQGAAFAVADGNVDAPNPIKFESIPVAKHWEASVAGAGAGRSVLFESMEMSAMEPMTRNLPKAALPPEPRKQASLRREFPARKVATLPGEPMQLASAPYQRNGFAIDFETVLAMDNMPFYSGQTYLVPTNQSIFLGGNVTFYPGCVVKMDRFSSLRLSGAPNCLGSMLSPSVITGVDDESYGESVGATDILRERMPAQPSGWSI